jgi:hypothetical protein
MDSLSAAEHLRIVLSTFLAVALFEIINQKV